jgi:hypothetical protein
LIVLVAGTVAAAAILVAATFILSWKRRTKFRLGREQPGIVTTHKRHGPEVSAVEQGVDLASIRRLEYGPDVEMVSRSKGLDLEQTDDLADEGIEMPEKAVIWSPLR